MTSKYLQSFKDILTDRRTEYSNFMWISRHLDPKAAYERLIKPTPNFHKEEVLRSVKIQEIIDRISRETGLQKGKLANNVWTILNEIGFNKRLSIIRWLGFLLTKIGLQVYSGIKVNEEKLLKIKEQMGNKPVVFLPTHRSYADFIVMSYLCFTYNIEIPAIAAGMDFYSMWVMGSVLRDTGAFFMRRSFNNDHLYWDTFRQYIHQIITEGDLPLEFFVEGTRSRSGKFLVPKLGLLSMVLKPFFTAGIPDILFIPINISYDRVLEEKLFAYELLGVPKPKESTSGFFKSLSIMKENYGNLYVDFGDPISGREFFGGVVNRALHNIRPIHLQEFTEQEKSLTAKLANEIVINQQKCSVITTFNIIALALTNNYAMGCKGMKVEDLVEDVSWINDYLIHFGAHTELDSVDIQSALKVHKHLIEITSEKTVKLVDHCVALKSIDSSKLRGHALSQDTMNSILPFVMLQLYVNPALHYISQSAMIIIILQHHKLINKDNLFTQYTFLQTLFSHEFVSCNTGSNSKFEELLQDLANVALIHCDSSGYYLSDSNKLQMFLRNNFTPFLFTYYTICNLLLQSDGMVNEKTAAATVQSQIEKLIAVRKCFIHPYCLNLDTIANAFSSLTSMEIIRKEKVDDDTFWNVNMEQLINLCCKIEVYLDAELRVDKLQPSRTVLLSSKL
uniref:Phospholipid/glycerol acyltransferase domain-containing protein n=1 Tax=Photinus pyralis TaxID=7054 RepID=A0A1Y1NBK6_PHOPY